MWFLIVLLLLTTPAMAQKVDDAAAVKADIIDLPYTKEQQEVVADFTKEYFDQTQFIKQAGDVTIDQFLNKDTNAQDSFVSDWAVKERNRLVELKKDLDTQSQSVQTKIDQLNKALVDWKK